MSCKKLCPVFSNFARLPTELRISIWQHALFGEDRPALYFYKPGCWQYRRKSPEEEGFDLNGHEEWILEFHPESLDHILVRIPLFEVNWEARLLVSTWALQQGLEERSEETEHPFMRPIRLMFDMLYVPHALIDSFFQEARDPDSDLVADQMVYRQSPALTHLALPEASVCREAEGGSFYELLEFYNNLTTIFVVVGAQPDSKQRWELSWAQRSAYLWNAERQSFDRELSDKDASYSDVLEQIDREAEALAEELLDLHVQSFEIRLAIAIVT